jgi:hypothetical protein
MLTTTELSKLLELSSGLESILLKATQSDLMYISGDVAYQKEYLLKHLQRLKVDVYNILAKNLTNHA